MINVFGGFWGLICCFKAPNQIVFARRHLSIELGRARVGADFLWDHVVLVLPLGGRPSARSGGVIARSRDFSVVYFSRGTLPKKRVKGHYWGT